MEKLKEYWNYLVELFRTKEGKILIIGLIIVTVGFLAVFKVRLWKSKRKFRRRRRSFYPRYRRRRR